MCILGLAVHAHPEIPFLCVHNRDEFFDRPVSASLDASPPLLCAVDLAAGGTWMGLNAASGVLVALTNVRSRMEAPPGARSRGELVMKLLHGAIPVHALAAAAAAVPVGRLGRIDLGALYSGFNLIVCDLRASPSRVFYVTNRTPGYRGASLGSASDAADARDRAMDDQLPATHAWVEEVPTGVHAFSNSWLDDTRWAKVRYVQQALAGILPLAVPSSGARDHTLTHSAAQAADDGRHTLLASTAATGGAAGGDPVPRSTTAAAAVTSDVHLPRPHLPPLHPTGDSSAAPTSAEQALLRSILAHVTEMMTRHAPLPAEHVMADLTWSNLPPDMERTLQQHVFIPPLPAYRYGTRSTTAVVQLASGAIYYCYASWDVLLAAAFGQKNDGAGGIAPAWRAPLGSMPHLPGDTPGPEAKATAATVMASPHVAGSDAVATAAAAGRALECTVVQLDETTTWRVFRVCTAAKPAPR